MSEVVEPVVVGGPNGVVDELLIESKVDEIKENISLDALKCAIEAIGDAMAELAETSANAPKESVEDVQKQEVEELQSHTEIPSNLANEKATVYNISPVEETQPNAAIQAEDTVTEPEQSPPDGDPVNVEATPAVNDVPTDVSPTQEEQAEQSSNEPTAAAEQVVADNVEVPLIVREVVLVVEERVPESDNEPQSSTPLIMDSEAVEEEEVQGESKLGEDMSETAFESALHRAMSLHNQEDGTQTDLNLVTSSVVLVEPEVQSIDLEDEEVEVEVEVEVDDEDTTSQVTNEDGEKPKKKKKLRIMKKIRRAPGKLAYGALFGVGALVGGTLVGGQAIGHGAKSGAGFVADTTGKIAEGTKDIAKSAASKVADGAKAGGDFVVGTGGKIADGTKDTATSFVKATAGAVGDIFDATEKSAVMVADGTRAGANAALFGVGAVVGGTIAGGQAIGHGVVSGTKAIGQGVAEGSKAIGHGVVGGTKAIGHGVVDGTKASAKFVVDTKNKAVDHIEEKARQTLIAAVEATSAGAQFAGYGKQQGNPLAIEAKKSQK